MRRRNRLTSSTCEVNCTWSVLIGTALWDLLLFFTAGWGLREEGIVERRQVLRYGNGVLDAEPRLRALQFTYLAVFGASMRATLDTNSLVFTSICRGKVCFAFVNYGAAA